MSEIDKPKTPPPSDPVAPAPDTYVADNTLVRYVGEEAVAPLVAQGWVAIPFIVGSREFAFEMQRPAQQTDAPEDQTA